MNFYPCCFKEKSKQNILARQLIAHGGNIVNKIEVDVILVVGSNIFEFTKVFSFVLLSFFRLLFNLDLDFKIIL